MLELVDGATITDALKDTLSNLQLDYLDMYVIHDLCPKVDKDTLNVDKVSLQDCWREMEHNKNKGLCRSLGLVNCPTVFLLDILTFCETKPAINFLEIHPYLN